MTDQKAQHFKGTCQVIRESNGFKFIERSHKDLLVAFSEMNLSWQHVTKLSYIGLYVNLQYTVSLIHYYTTAVCKIEQ